MIAIVVGVNLVPGIIDSVNKASENGTLPEGTAVSALADVLPIIFVVVIIMGAVAWIAGAPGASRTRERIRETVERIRLHGRFGWLPTTRLDREWYRDRAIGISGEQMLANIGATGVFISQLESDRDVGSEPMTIFPSEKKLWIDTNFDWYIMEKNPDFEMYKMVGVHKKQRGLNCVYIVGQDSHTLQSLQKDFLSLPYISLLLILHQHDASPYRYSPHTNRHSVG